MSHSSLSIAIVSLIASFSTYLHNMLARCYDAVMKNNVIYVDFSNRQAGEMWELHYPFSMIWDDETDFALAIRCPDEKYKALIARRIEKLDALKTPYKIFFDGELVHHEEHLGCS
jgi:hypothetical protein